MFTKKKKKSLSQEAFPPFGYITCTVLGFHNKKYHSSLLGVGGGENVHTHY